MRRKISALFGFHLSDDGDLGEYLNRMDKIGQLDQSKLVKLVLIFAEEIESQKKEYDALATKIETVDKKISFAKK